MVNGTRRLKYLILPSIDFWWRESFFCLPVAMGIPKPTLHTSLFALTVMGISLKKTVSLAAPVLQRIPTLLRDGMLMYLKTGKWDSIREF
jgi:hypothetical protein